MIITVVRSTNSWPSSTHKCELQVWESEREDEEHQGEKCEEEQRLDPRKEGEAWQHKELKQWQRVCLLQDNEEINFSMNKTIVCWFSIRINRQVLLDVKKATLLSKLNIFSSNYLPIFYDLRMRMETDVVIFVRMILMLMVLTTTSILVQTILEFMPRISELTKLLYLILMEIHKSIQIGSFITKVWLPY